jgi:hypothetical protein
MVGVWAWVIEVKRIDSRRDARALLGLERRMSDDSLSIALRRDF